LLNILSRPFDDQPEFAAFAEPAPEGRGCYQPSAAPETHISPASEGRFGTKRNMILSTTPPNATCILL
jgi:hypothetical protein